MLRFGFVTTYMGDAMVSGFTTGAAVHVFTSQVKYVFGIDVPRFPNLFQIINVRTHTPARQCQPFTLLHRDNYKQFSTRNTLT